MVTLTGTFTRLDGTPAAGMVRVTPSRSPILDSDGKIVISGPQTFALDKDGKLTVQIPASNDPDLGPPFTYTVEALLSHKPWKISKVWIPHGSSTVDLSEIGDYTPTPGVATRVVTIPADGEDGQVLVWDGAGFSWMDAPAGPKGDPGEVTTAALTTALAGKVTGTGMTVRVDTTVGTRVLLDHPGGTTMLYGDTGWRTITSCDTAGVVTGDPLPAGLTPLAGIAGAIETRRLTDRSQWRITGFTLTTAPKINMPTGFGARRAAIIPIRIGSTPGHAQVSTSNFRLVLDVGYPLNGSNFSTLLELDAPTAWPTTLPGLPS